MSSIFADNSPILIIKRKGNDTDPYVKYSHNITVNDDGVAVLKEIPNKFTHVKIDKMFEKQTDYYSNDEIKENEYVVDYRMGFIHFNSIMNGKTIKVEYDGKGVILYPASRIYIDGKKDVVTTIQDMIDGGKSAIEAYGNIDNAIKVAEEYYIKINSCIEDGKVVDGKLNTTIINAKDIDKLLNETILKAKEIDNTLNGSILNGNNKITEMDSKIKEVDNNEEIRQTNEENRKQAEIQRNTIFNEKETKRQQTFETNENARELKNETMMSSFYSSTENYNNDKQYRKYNRVTFNGSSYECLKDCKSVLPTENEYWICIAKKGQDGNGTGNMHIDTYDKNGNGVVDNAEVAESANSVEWVNVQNRPDVEKLQQQLSENATKTVTDTSNVIHMTNSVDGLCNIEMQGNTLYKRADGTYTNTWEEGCTLESVGEKEKKIEVISCGKNLFDKSKKTSEKGYRINEGFGTLYQKSDINDYTLESYISDYIEIKPSANYVFTRQEIEGKKIYQSVAYYDSNKNFISGYSSCYSVNNYYSITTPKNAKYIKVTFINKDTFQLEYGNQATTYEPYKSDKIDILTTELPKFDKICGDKLIKGTGKTVLNGTENIQLGTNDVTNISFMYDSLLMKTGGKCICDKMPIGSPSEVFLASQIGVVISQSMQRLLISIEKSKLVQYGFVEGDQPTYVLSFKKWIQANPTTVYYELATPVVEKLPQPLTLKCFANGTIQVNTVAPPTVAIKYPSNINSRLSNVEEVNNTMLNSLGNAWKDIAKVAGGVDKIGDLSTVDKEILDKIIAENKDINVVNAINVSKNILNDNIKNTKMVTGVNGKTGEVTLKASDITTEDNKTIEEFKTSVESQLADKATKQPTATENNITVFDNIGNIKDSGKAIGNTSGKILELPTGLIQGDLLRIGSNGQVERLPKGVDGQGLILKNGLPIWGSVGTKIVNGSYAGDGTPNRGINIGFEPKLVILIGSGDGWNTAISNNNFYVVKSGLNPFPNKGKEQLLLTSTGFSLSSDSTFYHNKSGVNYYYTAIG